MDELGREQAASHGHVARTTRDELDDLLHTMHGLESALASPGPGREGRWATRVEYELDVVLESLDAHVQSAEQEGGLFAHILESAPNAATWVERLREDHAELRREVVDLRARIARFRGDDSVDPHDFRMLAARVLHSLRRHEAKETDLIFETLWVDIGVGD